MKISICTGLSIDANELSFTFTRSSKPGGQNVNKLNTRVTLWFDLRQSPSLTPLQKTKIAATLAGRINAQGVLHVVSQRHRTQAANRRATVQRFAELLADVLKPRPPRKPTRPGRAAIQRRLVAKRQRAQQKKERSRKFDSEN